MVLDQDNASILKFMSVSDWLYQNSLKSLDIALKIPHLNVTENLKKILGIKVYNKSKLTESNADMVQTQ